MVCAHSCQVRKCIFSRLLDLSNFLLTTRNLAWRISSPVSTWGAFSLPIARPATCRFIVKVFAYKPHYKIQINLQIMKIFRAACKSLLAFDDETFMVCSVPIMITTLIHPKTKTFLVELQPLSKAPALLNNLMQALYFLCSDSYWLLAAFSFSDSISYPFQQSLIYYYSFNNLTHSFLFSLKRFRFSFLLLVLAFIFPFWCHVFLC